MPIKSYKGFAADMTCRGFQFKVGEEYTHEGAVEACSSGFHACEYPLDVLSYYGPATSVYAEVEQGGTLARHTEDSKVASSVLRVKASLDLPGLIKAAVDYTFSKVKQTGAASNSGYGGAASNSGDYGAASNSGTRGAASNSGTRGAASNSGDYGAASNSGTHGSASNSGGGGAASNSGDGGAASNSGTRGAASNSGDYGAASNSGDYGSASNSGTRGAASNSGTYGSASNSGDYGAASNSGTHGSATSTGFYGKVKGVAGSSLFLTERNDDGEIIAVGAAIVGKTEGVESDTWYTLKHGKFVAVKD